jgi:hypothetical protein
MPLALLAPEVRMARQRSKQPAKSRPAKEGPKQTRSAHQKHVQGKSQRGRENAEGDDRPKGNLGSQGQNLGRSKRGTGRAPGDIGDERGPRAAGSVGRRR